MRLSIALLIAAALAFAAAGWCHGQNNGGRAIRPLNPSFATANAVFDGSTDNLTKSAILTGLSDSKATTFSFWVRFDGGDGIGVQLWMEVFSSTSWVSIDRTTANKIHILARNGSSVVILDATSNQTVTIASGWTHINICIDLANVSNRHFYFNGLDDVGVTWTTYTNETMDFQHGINSDFSVGGTTSGGSRLNGALTEFWWDDTYLNDPSKFIAGGCPISLGPNGNLPTGSAPVLYLSLNGSGNSWAIDSSGNGNSFTVVGALGSTTSPCQ